MTGLTVRQSCDWAVKARRRLQALGCEVYSPMETETGHLKPTDVIAPEANGSHPLSRREIFFHFDRGEVHRADVLFVNVTALPDNGYSLGTDFELAWAYTEMDMIIIVARPTQAYARHPFIKACGAVIFEHQKDALDFLEHYIKAVAGINGGKH